MSTLESLRGINYLPKKCNKIPKITEMLFKKGMRIKNEVCLKFPLLDF